MRHLVYIVHAEILTPGFTGLRMTLEVVNVIPSVARNLGWLSSHRWI